MNGAPIPHLDHIAHYCPPGKVDRDPLTMEPNFIQPDNFKLKILSDGNLEDGISVNYVERHNKPTMEEAIISIIKCMQSYPYKISRNGVFAVIKVKTTIDIGAKYNNTISVIENHLFKNEVLIDDSHALIVGIEIGNEPLQQEIALSVDICRINK